MDLRRALLIGTLALAACGRRTFPVGEVTGGGGGHGDGGGGSGDQIGDAGGEDGGSPDAGSEGAAICNPPGTPIAVGFDGLLSGTTMGSIDGISPIFLDMHAADHAYWFSFNWRGPALNGFFALGQQVTVEQDGHWSVVRGPTATAAAYFEDSDARKSHPEPLPLTNPDASELSLSYSLQCSNACSSGDREWELYAVNAGIGKELSTSIPPGATATVGPWQITNTQVSWLSDCAPGFRSLWRSALTVLGPPTLQACALDASDQCRTEGGACVACSSSGYCQPPNRGGPCGGVALAGCDPGFTCLPNSGCPDGKGLCLTDAERAWVCGGPLADQFACP